MPVTPRQVRLSNFLPIIDSKNRRSTMWYSVSILMKSVSSEVAGGALLWEETIILVAAKDESDARVKGEKIRWTYDRVFKVFEINRGIIGDGTEVFSRFLRDSEVNSMSNPFDELP